MLILGIETSCDETAASLVENGTKVLSSVVTSSTPIQKKYGGIFPEQAAREQLKCIIPIIQEAFQNLELRTQNLDAIAVTIGPGLIGSLLIGVETAKTLAYLWHKPIIPINHVIAHLYANFLSNQSTIPPALKLQQASKQPSINQKASIQFPALGLIVSGGHTELILIKNHHHYHWLGGTRDDAAGECFDKCSRLLVLGYPGGPAIEAAAKRFKINNLRLKNQKLPRPMINNDNFDFSFSGLKTALFYLLKNHQSYILNHQSLLAYELQEAITDVLVTKTIKAALKLKVKSILIGGGVAANQRLREKFTFVAPLKLFIPDKKWCTDNAAMVASAAFYNFRPRPWQKIKPEPALEI